jgi:prolyl 4-hydroxylase
MIGWMIVNCPVSCNACHLRDSKERCQRSTLNITDTQAFTASTLDNMFSTLKKRLGDKHGIVKVVSTDPWIVIVDDFVTDDESSDLISGISTWERSTDAGEMNEYGESGRTLTFGRTSSNSWCRGPCEKQKNVVNLANRISQYTTVPVQNFEAFQVLRYEVGQQYVLHHDYSQHQRELACGPRIISVLLYLSDVREGGETVFPDLGITVKPKKGRAVFFPDALSTNLELPDVRTSHKAKAVLKGQKYAVNSWLHLYDFKKSNLWGCTGLFDVL